MSMRAVVLGCAGIFLTSLLTAQGQKSPANNSNLDKRSYPLAAFNCVVNAPNPSLPAFSNASINGDLVFLNSRIKSGDEAFWTPPKNKIFILTDIVVQNRAPGDEPVTASQFTRFAITSPASTDVFLSVFSNVTFSAHLKTGIPVASPFRFYNVVNSTAPFVEVFITGVLRDCGKKD